jgi:hypothetical protein
VVETRATSTSGPTPSSLATVMKCEAFLSGLNVRFGGKADTLEPAVEQAE